MVLYILLKNFYKENNDYREINKNGIKRFEFIKKDNLINDLIDNEYLVNTEVSEINENKIILKHEKLNFISYPYEWTFTQLKDAALFHLDLQIFLLNKNAKLIDASAYNIQFKNNKPIFIDILSIDKYSDG